MSESKIMQAPESSRLARSNELRQTHRKIPVFVSSKSIALKKDLYLCAPDLTVGKLMHLIRTYSRELKAQEGMYMFGKNDLLIAHASIGELDKQYRDTDGFVKISVEKENTYG